MRSGVRIREVVDGNGEEAVSGKTVVVNVRFFLNRGAELSSALTGGPRMVIDLARRDCIAGLKYGIEGMRVGEQREITISPHLAYGAEGIPGHVPPNAVIRCQVELIDVRENGVRRPEDYPAEKQLFVFHPGEASRNLPRWQFGLKEDGRGGILITYPHLIPGMAWRRPRHCHKETHFDAETTRSLFESAVKLQESYSKDCFPHDELIADSAERGNSITRHKLSKILCLTIGVTQRGQWLTYFALAENSLARFESPILKVISDLLEQMEQGNKIGD